MSGDLQLIDGVRGDSFLQGTVETLRMAQLTLQGLSRQFPQQVFGSIANVWRGMNKEERQDKGFGFGALWDQYKKEKQERS
jgi:hypothetical protein